MKNICVTILLSFLFACEAKFDAPPLVSEEMMNVTTTIRQLKTRHIKGNFELITEDITIGAVVIADDKSGNFYKTIVIQDASGGIAVKLDGTGLFNNYPIGRKIYIKLKGLYLGDYAGLIQLGGGIDNSDPSKLDLTGIPSSLFDKYIIKGSLNNTIAPKQISIASLTSDIQDTLQNTLIQIAGLEFSEADTAKNYAPSLTSSNYLLTNCAGAGVILRTSGYSNFANTKLPKGNGTLNAIFTVFGNTKQLYVRDTADVQFKNARCKDQPQPVLTTVSAVRALYKGTALTLPDLQKIKGVVISDRSSKNFDDNKLVLQQGSSGIVIQFNSPHNFELNDEVEVDISKAELSQQNSVLTITKISADKANKTATGSLSPKPATVADILAAYNDLESTLIKISSATIEQGVWKGGKQLKDATGTIKIYIKDEALFSADAVPSGDVSCTAIVSTVNGEKLLVIRNTADVVSVVAPPPPATGVINLTGTSMIFDFNNLNTALPDGISVRTGAKNNFLGNAVTFNTAKGQWSNSTGAFKNYASATGLNNSADNTIQDASGNRALGVRQVGTSSTFPESDPGAAFVFALANTTGKTSLTMSFKLQSLDVTAARTTAWIVDYGIGDNPAVFTPVAATGIMTTGNSIFASNQIDVAFPAALNNVSQKIWIRIVTLNATTGTGSRPSSAIDDVKFSWK